MATAQEKVDNLRLVARNGAPEWPAELVIPRALFEELRGEKLIQKAVFHNDFGTGKPSDFYAIETEDFIKIGVTTVRPDSPIAAAPSPAEPHH